jgi:hypothetical protein
VLADTDGLDHQLAIGVPGGLVSYDQYIIGADLTIAANLVN